MRFVPSLLALVLALAGCSTPTPVASAAIEPLIAVPRGVLEPTDGAADDELGAAVAITPARDWIFVGSPYHAASGAVYAFARTATGWELRTTIVATELRDGDLFGRAIATDGTRLVIGAPGDDSVLFEGAGSIYVYRIESGTFTFEQRVDNPDPTTSNERFGSAVAIADDSTIAVGAPAARAFFIGAGATYVLTRSGTTWSVAQALEPSTLSSGDTFGDAVAATATTIAVGASYDDEGAYENTGAVFVFVRGATEWVQQARLLPSTRRSHEYLGSSIAIDPSGMRIAAGARGGDDNEDLIAYRGVAYVFAREGTTWSEEARVLPSPATDWTSYGFFGTAVAIDGDFLVVGGPGTYRASLGRDPGFAYAYSRGASGWGPELDVTGRLRTMSFGRSVALVGGTLAVGAPDEDVTGADGRGAAYAYELVDPRPAGEACAVGVECESGFCADGVCCNSACGGNAVDCEVCSVAAGGTTDGVCTTAAADAVCRPAGGTCDLPEVCDGAATTCPADITADDGSPCDDGLVCNGADACQAGACVAGTSSPECDDADPCTADSCADPAGCAHAPIDGCVACEVAADCPAMACGVAECRDGVCAYSAAGCDGGSADGSVDPDGGVAPVDGGTIDPGAAGCGCAIPGGGDRDVGGPTFGGLALVLAALGLALARRRSCRS